MPKSPATKNQRVTLITGGNKGLGFETARRLKALGHNVYIGARNADLGRAAAAKLDVHFVLLDVTDKRSVHAAAAHIMQAEQRLDVLINNAGIAPDSSDKAPDVTADKMRTIFDTNLFGMVEVTHAFIPLLRQSEAGVIVQVSSGLGSFATITDSANIESTIDALAYCTSKAAVTMAALQYAKALPQLRVNAVDPGYTATDLNNHSGPQTVTEGTDAIVAMACIGKDGPTGTFVSRHGIMPW